MFRISPCCAGSSAYSTNEARRCAVLEVRVQRTTRSAAPRLALGRGFSLQQGGRIEQERWLKIPQQPQVGGGLASRHGREASRAAGPHGVLVPRHGHNFLWWPRSWAGLEVGWKMTSRPTRSRSPASSSDMRSRLRRRSTSSHQTAKGALATKKALATSTRLSHVCVPSSGLLTKRL